jgi:dienelactone hydrolase
MRKHAALVLVLVLVLSILWTRVTAAQAIEQFSVPVDHQGGQIQLKGELQKPAGEGPFPVVIALHSCVGYGFPYSMRSIWLPLFRQQGYATVQVDSFTARLAGRVCLSDSAVTSGERGMDAVAAAYALAERPDVRRDRIAVIGWSHGGSGAAAAAKDGPMTQSSRERLASRGGKLVASIDFYGGCGDLSHPVVVPLLVLVGALDQWISVDACVALAKRNPTLMAVQVYPGASHSFDDESGEYNNTITHAVMRYDPAATADARARVTEFLRRYMQ